jgi:hypothetical protein
VDSRPVLGKSVCLGAPAALHRTAVEGRTVDRQRSDTTRYGKWPRYANGELQGPSPVPFLLSADKTAF